VLIIRIPSGSTSILVVLVVCAFSAASESRQDRHGNSPDESLITRVVAREIRVLKLADRADLCLGLLTEGQLRDPSPSLIRSFAARGFRLHSMSWCAPHCRENPKAGEQPDLICDKMPRGIMIRAGEITWRSPSSARLQVDTTDDSLKKADFGLILQKGIYSVEREPAGVNGGLLATKDSVVMAQANDDVRPVPTSPACSASQRWPTTHTRWARQEI